MELKFNNPNTKVGYDAVFKNRPVITPESFEEAAEKYIHNLKNTIELSNRVISLPMHPYLSHKQVDYISITVDEIIRSLI